MPHVFRLGPFTVGDRDAYAYAAIADDGAMLPPQVAHTDAKGLAALAKGLQGPLRCEPALKAAAAKLGFVAAELPAEALVPRAVLAFGLGLGDGWKDRPPLELLLRFFGACAAYWRAAPWRFMGSDDPLPVELDDGRRRVAREASVMGGGGDEYGLALYDEPGSIARVVAAVNRGRMDDAARVASVAVTFDPEPAWAVAALEDAFGLPRFPLPMRVRKGTGTMPNAEDLHTLTAVLAAVTALAEDDDLEPSVATVEARGVALTARVRMVDPAEELDDDLAEPMPVPVPLAPAQRSERTPRNAPCPCGSGRKYKKCHLAEDEARERAARAAGPAGEEARAQARRLAERDPVHALAERITADALALARRCWGSAFDPEGALCDAGIDFATAQGLLGWCSDHYRGPTGSTALELYVTEHGAALDEPARRLTAALREAWFSVHEVIAAEPGVSVTLRDLLAGGERTVQERTASRTVSARDVLLARVVDLGDRAILAGCHLRTLPPREGDRACRLARKALRTRAKAIPPAKLRALTAGGALFAGWQELVHALDERPPPRLQNTDGEDLLLTVDRFELAAGDLDRVIAGLLSLPDARRDDEGAGAAEISFVRQGNAKGLLPTTLVGRAIVEGTTLRLETNSVPRADGLKRQVLERLGALVRFQVRTHEDPVAGRAGRATRAGEAAPPPEAIAILRAVQVEHYRKWMDEPIPALGGLSPRAAARRKGAPRERLRLLLAEIENAEARAPEGQRFDVGSLRRELGVP